MNAGELVMWIIRVVWGV